MNVTESAVDKSKNTTKKSGEGGETITGFHMNLSASHSVTPVLDIFTRPGKFVNCLLFCVFFSVFVGWKR